jgi:hypothetical protein
MQQIEFPVHTGFATMCSSRLPRATTHFTEALQCGDHFAHHLNITSEFVSPLVFFQIAERRNQWLCGSNCLLKLVNLLGDGQVAHELLMMLIGRSIESKRNEEMKRANLGCPDRKYPFVQKSTAGVQRSTALPASDPRTAMEGFSPLHLSWREFGISLGLYESGCWPLAEAIALPIESWQENPVLPPSPEAQYRALVKWRHPTYLVPESLGEAQQQFQEARPTDGTDNPATNRIPSRQAGLLERGPSFSPAQGTAGNGVPSRSHLVDAAAHRSFESLQGPTEIHCHLEVGASLAGGSGGKQSATPSSFVESSMEQDGNRIGSIVPIRSLGYW